MNVVATQMPLLVNGRQVTNGNASLGNGNSNSFGSIFSSLTSHQSQEIAVESPSKNTQMIQALFNAQTIEDVHADWNEMKHDLFLGTFEQVANAFQIEPEQLLQSIESLFSASNLQDSDLHGTDNIWNILEKIEDIGPVFFERLLHSLNGNGQLPNNSATEVLTFLKSVELTASETDLLLKQEQLVFSMQNLLSSTGERFENEFKATNISNRTLLQLSEMSQFHMTNHSEMNANSGDEKGEKHAQLSAINNGANTPVTNGGFSLQTSEAETNNRSEILLREIQTIFKRAQFGQTGGTNRLLIKLNPEHLGQLRIELIQTNGIMTARILASTALGKEMLENQLSHLRQAFVQQNVQVERIDISQMLQDTTRHDRDSQAFQEQFRGNEQNKDHENEKDKTDETTFQQYLIELEV